MFRDVIKKKLMGFQVKSAGYACKKQRNNKDENTTNIDIEDDLNSLSIIRGNYAIQTVYGGQVVLQVEP